MADALRSGSDSPAAHRKVNGTDRGTLIPEVAVSLNAERDGYNDGSDQTYLPVAGAMSADDGDQGGTTLQSASAGYLIPDTVSPLLAGANDTGGTRPPGSLVENADQVIVQQAMSAKWAKGTSGPAGDEHHNLIAVQDTREIEKGQNGFGVAEDVAYTVDTTGAQGIAPVAFAVTPQGHREGDGWGGFEAAGLSVTETEVAATLDGGAGTTALLEQDTAATLSGGSSPNSAIPGRHAEDDVNLLVVSMRGRAEGNVPEVEASDVSPAIRQGDGGSGNPMLVAAYRLYPEHGQGADLAAVEIDTSPALDATSEARKSERGARIVAFNPTGGSHSVDAGEVAPPLRVGSGVGIPSGPAIAGVDSYNLKETGEVAHSVRDGHGQGTPGVVQVDGEDTASTLRGFGHGWQGQHNSTNAVTAPPLTASMGNDAGHPGVRGQGRTRCRHGSCRGGRAPAHPARVRAASGASRWLHGDPRRQRQHEVPPAWEQRRRAGGRVHRTAHGGCEPMREGRD